MNWRWWFPVGSALTLGAGFAIPGGRWGPCGPVNGVAEAQLGLVLLGALGLGLAAVVLSVSAVSRLFGRRSGSGIDPTGPAGTDASNDTPR